jgi:hypothetical protein
MSVGGSLPFIARGFSAAADCCPRSSSRSSVLDWGIAVAQYPAQGPADHHPCSDDWRCRFLAAEIRTWDGPVKMASMSPDSFCWAIGKSMWFGRSSFCAGHLYMREGAVTNRVEGRNEFEHQGPVAYGRLCPTALGSVPPSASTQQQSDTQPRPAPHPNPIARMWFSANLVLFGHVNRSRTKSQTGGRMILQITLSRRSKENH